MITTHREGDKLLLDLQFDAGEGLTLDELADRPWHRQRMQRELELAVEVELVYDEEVDHEEISQLRAEQERLAAAIAREQKAIMRSRQRIVRPRAVARRSCGGRRRPGGRRVASRSAGGGSGDPHLAGDEPPGEAGLLEQDDVAHGHLRTDVRGRVTPAGEPSVSCRPDCEIHATWRQRPVSLTASRQRVDDFLLGLVDGREVGHPSRGDGLVVA